MSPQVPDLIHNQLTSSVQLEVKEAFEWVCIQKENPRKKTKESIGGKNVWWEADAFIINGSFS